MMNGYSIDRSPRELAHTDGPDTEHEAAAANAVSKATNRLKLLVVYDAHQLLTSYHAWVFYPAMGMDLTEVRRRCTDLLNEGLLYRSTLRSKLPTGRYAYLLGITPAGRAVLDARAVLYALKKETP